MDALALLCTIHADGPATLTRLRSAGIATLAQVTACDAVPLAALLRCGVAQARRFQREAGGLGERLESDSPVLPVVSKKQDKRPAPKAAPKASAGPKKLEEVLARWRSLDSSMESTLDSNAVSSTLAAVTPATVPTGLEAGSVDGLDLTAVEVLAQHGVTTLAVLAVCDAVHIGTASGLGYTRVHRWRALANRALAAAPRMSLAEPRAEERGAWSAPVTVTPAEVMPLSRDYVMQPVPRQALPQPPEAPSNEESAAGPFA